MTDEEVERAIQVLRDGMVQDTKAMAELSFVRGLSTSSQKILGQVLARDFYLFSKFFFYILYPGNVFVENWHIKELCKLVELVDSGSVKKLLVNMPPSWHKTYFLVVANAAWVYSRYSNAKFVHVSYTHGKAEQNAVEVRNVLRSEQFILLYGDLLTTDNKAKVHWTTEAGGHFHPAGSEGSITGHHAGVQTGGEFEYNGALILDDPNKAQNQFNVEYMEKVYSNYISAATSRLAHDNVPIIVVMQRLSDVDFTQQLVDKFDDFTHFKLPALDEDGETNYEGKFSTKSLMDIKKSDPYFFSAQYMQEPYLPEVMLFKREWWQWLDHVEYPELIEVFVTGDTAQKTGQHNDFTAFVLWGIMRNNGLVALDTLHGKYDAVDLEREFIVKYSEWNKRRTISAVYIEDKSSGTGLIQQLQSRGGFPVRAVQRDKDKVNRALESQGFLESGNVYALKGNRHCEELVDEVCRFQQDMKHKHDDLTDNFIDAVKIAASRVSYSSEAIESERVEDYVW